LAGLPLIKILSCSQASFAMVLRLISLEFFKNLSIRIPTPCLLLPIAPARRAGEKKKAAQPLPF
jgi:hypothetical protein